MMSYAGVALTATVDPDARAFLETWWNLEGRHRQRITAPLAFNAGRFPNPNAVPPERPRPNVLAWPNDATRWGEVSVYVTHEQLTSIRAAVGLTLLDYHDFVMSDGTNSVTASLMFLGARPVMQRKSGPGDLYLMTLVDYRYYWQMVGPFASSVGAATWNLTLKNRMNQAGIGIHGAALTISTIDADYLTPIGSDDLYIYTLWPSAVVIDGIAAMLGCRVIRPLAQAAGSFGTASVLNPADAKAIYDANWTAAVAQAGLPLCGGRFDGTDVARGLPYSVSVSFPGDRWGIVNVLLPDLALADAGGCEGVQGPSATVGAAVMSAPHTTLGPSDYSAYATRAATDWYLRQLYDTVDATFAGIVAWSPSGIEDRVEWEHGWDNTCCTRVYRGPYNDRQLWAAPDSPVPSLATAPTDLGVVPGPPASGQVSLSGSGGGTYSYWYRIGGSGAFRRYTPAGVSGLGVTLNLVSGTSYSFFVRPFGGILDPIEAVTGYGYGLYGTTSNIVSFTAP